MLRIFLAPPYFDDPEKNRVGQLLNVTILLFFGVTVVTQVGLIFIEILLGNNVFSDPGTILSIIISISVMGILVGLKFLLNRGDLIIPSWVLTVVLFLVGLLSTLTFGGIRDPGIAIFLLVVIVAGLLLGRTISMIFAGLGLVATLVTYILQANQIISFDVTAPVSFSDWGIFAGILLMTGLLQQYAVGNLQEAYQRAFANERQLKDSNWELAQMQATLEETIAERTRQLETRNKYLEASANIARETTSLLDIETMLSRVVLSISQEFNFYHVGIFLVDDKNEWAELKAASSPGGLQMIARGHRLRVGKQGIVGYVTGIGQQRITQSTELDLIHSVTPELPETRAEMGLPLKARGEIIGALDIQHNEPNPFNEDNISILQTLADQIALALSNARLYQQAQQSIEETRRAYGEYNREAWLESQKIGALPSYRFSPERMGAPERTNPRERISLEGKNKIAIPIQVRGLTIGSIDIVKNNDDEEWTKEQQDLLQNLSDQLGIALDSARLFNETQKRAATERLVGEVSTDIRETLDVDTILRTASEKVRSTFDLPEVSIRLASQAPLTSENGSPNHEELDPQESHIDEA